MDENLTEREKNILETFFREFIISGHPVSSRQISRSGRLNLSSATVRNVMSDLEEMGLVTRPHKSAGNVPTRKGMRYYLDRLVRVTPLTLYEIRRIENEVRAGFDHATIMKEACRLLSDLSRYAGLVVPPKIDMMIFHRLEIFKIQDGKAVAILISSSGDVYRTIFDLDENTTQDELDRRSEYLNRNMAGLNFREVRAKVEEEIKKESIIYYRMMMRLLFMDDSFLMKQDEIYIGGEARVLIRASDSDFEAARGIMAALEEKKKLVSLLDGIKGGKGTTIIFGDETEYDEMKECSIIASQFGRNDQNLGMLGVMGPKRMDFPRLIPLVDYTAMYISRALSR